ncbi:hypothetical protein OSB04_022991 [Centaurea solstitialis]|uniref:Hybrid signal transduction histidine kinase M n=1 Tax=Centaurea solstitialis TaxID=347529 RepID=A0AA38SI85_9ASTR|nr:hypothetical protein OSB04_022991 [Centaurea solstitialis]
MAADDPPTPVNHKAFGITNIKSYIPLILDLEKLNYDAWREIFTTHCIGFDVIKHIDSTYDVPQTTPTDPEWTKLDSIVKLWIYGSITQALLQMVLKKDTTARQVWLSIEKLFRDNKDAKAIQLDSELRNITMGDLSVTAYCSKISGLADLLQNLDPESTVPDKHLVIYTINGLSSRFDYVASIIRHRTPYRPSWRLVQCYCLRNNEWLTLDHLRSHQSYGPFVVPRNPPRGQQ